jgi:hypothetical protein
MCRGEVTLLKNKAGRRALWVLSLLLAGCNDNPTASGPRTTETFTGVLQPQASVVHGFTVQQAGTLDMTLTSLSPLTSITVGFGVGLPSGTAGCDLQLGYTESARVGATLSGAIDPGSYCVALYDVGNVSQAVTYTITVIHP